MQHRRCRRADDLDPVKTWWSTASAPPAMTLKVLWPGSCQSLDGGQQRPILEVARGLQINDGTLRNSMQVDWFEPSSTGLV